MSTAEAKTLRIRNLRATVGDKRILNGIDLEIRPGEVHAIMGPNGSGKSTLAQVLAGRDLYDVTADEFSYGGADLLAMAPEERAREGIFLAFQYPVEIPGVSTVTLLKESLNAIRRHRGEAELDAMDFLTLVKRKLALVEMREEFLYRSVNESFSGGEKKRNEILQMAVLEPRLAILDETDSGLDIDALKLLADGVAKLRGPGRSFIVITHYQRLLEYIVPDHVHILAAGQIVKSGGRELALEIEHQGYAWLEREPGGAARSLAAS
ncbi:MAG: Fe-S cluster assembly ATPase SufC [Gammaproteobacteria bacterium]|nr:Fe-S cluster assembly ATPase SufC [Gammaproteobacteria bacterium]